MSTDAAAIASPPPPSRFLTLLCFTLVYILWGSTFLAIRIAVENLTPLTMGGVRFTIAGLLMLSIRASLGHRVFVPWRYLPRLACIGFLLWVTANVVLSWGELYINTGLAALLAAIIPLWFLLLERLTHSTDRLPPRGLAGIALGVAGVAILLWPDIAGHSHLSSRQLFGSFLVLCSSFSWAVGSILAKRWQMPIDLFVSSGWQLLFGGLFAGALALATGQARLSAFTAPGAASSLWAIVYLICAGSLVGFNAYVWLLKHVPIAKVGTYAYVNPVVALLLGYFLHEEKMNAYMVAGAAVVILSVILVTRAKVRQVGRGGQDLELPQRA
jgi:drug/metabolite transporter (DMT)-like permease